MEYAKFQKKLPPDWLAVTRTREKSRIRFIEGMVEPEECLQLINLGQVAAGLCGKSQLGPRDIETVVLRRPSYTMIADLADCVRRDLSGNLVPLETRLIRRDSGVRVFREVRRVLRSDGTCWLNYGDAYAGSWGAQSRGNVCVETSSLLGGQVYAAPKGTHTGSTKRTGLKPKDLMMMPARLALALQSDGWWLRSEIVWSKPNPMPESVTDRPTSAHEKVFLLTKSAKYFYDAEAVRKPVQVLETRGFRPGVYGGAPPGNPRKTDKQRGHSRRHAGFNGRWDEMSKAEQEAMGANLRNVWTISTFGYPEAHFATFPPALVEPCIKAGTSEEGCCAVCGSPFERLTERSYRNHGNRTTNGPRSVERRDETARFNRRLEAVHSSLGWQPNCVCDAGDPAPAVVLDPFAGAGTVGLVAARLGRNAILIELNPEYAEMARRRIHEDAPLFADVKADSVPKESHETAQLFAD